MESPADDPFLAQDVGNQAPRTNELDVIQLESGGEEAGLAGVADLKSGASDETSPNVPIPSPRQSHPARKVHSAAPSSSVIDPNEDIPRPYTSAGLESPPSSRSRITRHRNKKDSTLRKKTAREGKTPREERPRSADLNGWGDFNTDRLLRDDSELRIDRSNQIDALDGQRSRSRKSRRSTPATPSPRPNPWEGYLTLDTKEPLRPPMQALRPKSIEILTLDLAQVNQPTGRPSVTPKPLLGRASLERMLPPRSRPTTSSLPQPATSPPLLEAAANLFGAEIPSTPTNRTTIFERFSTLWSLILHCPASPVADHPSESSTVDAAPGSADVPTRSPFECSMAMVKVCKAVGISLAPSAATRLAFWYSDEQGVGFETFCDLVVQGAIQPALHHFNLDNSVEEYVAALDTILQSLLTTTPVRRRKDTPVTSPPPLRLKELHEIQPVFLSWKAGISPRLIQSAEDPPPTPTRALVTAEKVRRALEASASQHMLAHQLPSEEARVTHVENIRRKVQLHKSWKFASDPKFAERGITSPMPPVSRGSLSSGASVTSNDDLSEMLKRAHSVLPTSAESEELHRKEKDCPAALEDHFIPTDESAPEKDEATESEEVLVCCSCSVRRAVLWCSSCFTVSCQKCWQDVHSCMVDMSMVTSAVPAAKKPLLGPTALAMAKKRCGSATLRPPVAMIYLPTKAMIPGTLARGNPVVRHSRKSSNQAKSNAVKDVPAVVSSAMLPSLHKSRSDGTMARHRERVKAEEASTPTTDSTADLVKSLMMRMSPSTPTPGGRSTGSHTSMEMAARMHKHHTPSRPKLHLAPVSLDAELLLSHAPERKR
jgi:hypothetical protein